MKLRSRNYKVKRFKRRPAPNTVIGTVPPRRIENAKRRPREYLTVKEVAKLMEGARTSRRYGHRDATMILIAYRHGLRVSELCALRQDQIDFDRGLLHVRRVKNGTPSVHPLGGTELRSLRRLLREQPESRYVFLTERRSPMSAAGFRKMLSRTARVDYRGARSAGCWRRTCCGTSAGTPSFSSAAPKISRGVAPASARNRNSETFCDASIFRSMTRWESRLTP